MQIGPYVSERILPRIVEAYCSRAGIEFRSFSDDWVLRLTKGATTRWVVGYTFDLNGTAAGELAKDKVATYAALTAADVPVIPHYLVRSLPHELIHVRDLHEVLNGHAVVAKPLEGMGGRSVLRFDALEQALDMVRGSGEPAWAVSPHYDLQAEYRLIMFDDAVQLAYEKTNPSYRGKLKLFNLNYGAVAADIADGALLERLSAIARRAMQVTTLRFAAVDIVRMPDGSLCVLEVNDSISMEHYARQSAEYKKRAATVYDTIVTAMFA